MNKKIYKTCLGDYMDDKKIIYLDLNKKNNNNYEFVTSIEDAINKTKNDLAVFQETMYSLEKIKPDCDKLDYILAASSGALCGIIDIFLVSKPGDTLVGNITDKWFENKIIKFANLCGYEGNDLSNAIAKLERTFKIPYDQSIGGSIFKDYINLTPLNHHFKSLGHNPTLLGLFFSILNQFYNTSNFVSNGDFITLNNSDTNFELKGNNVASKLFCGFINWMGHLMSDISGSSGSAYKGNREIGIPSPIWSWVNDIIVLKSKLGISSNEFDKDMSDLAIKIFENGYDARFQTAQMIPVLINELLVRTIYSIRRLISYYKENVKKSIKSLWDKCEPFSNNSIKRMLTVAHGAFCLLDTADATVRALVIRRGAFNVEEFIMRINIVGLGRFAISLYGESLRGLEYHKRKKEFEFAEKEKIILDNYLEGLKCLSTNYNDKDLISFVDDFKNSKAYYEGFDKTIELARKRNVPEDKILKSKSEIDKKFGGA